MATVATFNSPQEVVDYLNSITLPASWFIIDKGAKYTVIDELGVNNYSVVTVDGEDELETALAAAVSLVSVLVKKAGGKFTFYSVDDVVGGTNSYLMKVTHDQAELETFLNTAITVLIIIEHYSQKVVIYT